MEGILTGVVPNAWGPPVNRGVFGDPGSPGGPPVNRGVFGDPGFPWGPP